MAIWSQLYDFPGPTMIFYAGDEDFEADGDCDHYIKSCPMVQTTKVGNLHNVMTWTIVMMMMVIMTM